MSIDSSHLLWRAFVDKATEEIACGELSFAEAVLRRAMKEAEARSELNPLVVEKAHELAEWHRQNNRYEDAARLYLSVLSARKRVLGSSHSDVGDSLERLDYLRKASEGPVDSEWSARCGLS